MKDSPARRSKTEHITSWIGSPSSLVVHTLIFASSFGAAVAGLVEWDRMLLVVTTVVSLEAIYLSIFIQMSVNRQAVEIEDLSEDVEDIQEDVEEMQEDVEEMHDDLETIVDDSAEEKPRT